MNDRSLVGGFAAGYARDRDLLLAHIVDQLASDPDVLAIWLEGSLGRGESDDLSDLDIGIVMNDARIADIVTDPGLHARAVVETSLELPAPSNAPKRGAYLLAWVPWGDGRIPFQVDWYWYAASSAVRPANARLVLNRTDEPIPVEERMVLSDRERDEVFADALRTGFAMAVIAAKRIVRGNAWVIASHLDSVDQLRLTAGWVLEHGARPPYVALRHRGLSGHVPNTRQEQVALLRSMVSELKDLAVASGQADCFAEIVTQTDQYLDGVFGDADPGEPRSLGAAG
ncbi:MAG: hypothetical protein QM753_02590 [Thermomicrobiales bacterium]